MTQEQHDFWIDAYLRWSESQSNRGAISYADDELRMEHGVILDRENSRHYRSYSYLPKSFRIKYP